MRIQALGNFSLNAIESTTADEQDVARIDGDILLVWMLTTTLGGHIDTGTFQQFQQALLHTFTADITRYRRIIRLTRYLIDLIDKHNTTLGCFHIIVGNLQQTGQNALHILANIASLGEYRSINDSKRHIEQFGDGTCQQGLARTGRAHHDNV